MAVQKNLKRFRIKAQAVKENIDVLTYVTQLVMSLEAIKSNLRWLSMVRMDKSTEGKRDRIIATISAMGRCAEAFILIGKGVESKHIARDMIRDAECLRLWDDISAEPPLITKCRRVRNKFFAHWDPDVAKSFVESQAFGDDIEPFIESEEGGFMETLYAWGVSAFAFDLMKDLGNPGDPLWLGKLETLFYDIGKLLGESTNLIAALVRELISKSGLHREFEPFVE